MQQQPKKRSTASNAEDPTKKPKKDHQNKAVEQTNTKQNTDIKPPIKRTGGYVSWEELITDEFLANLSLEYVKPTNNLLEAGWKLMYDDSTDKFPISIRTPELIVKNPNLHGVGVFRSASDTEDERRKFKISCEVISDLKKKGVDPYYDEILKIDPTLANRHYQFREGMEKLRYRLAELLYEEHTMSIVVKKIGDEITRYRPELQKNKKEFRKQVIIGIMNDMGSWRFEGTTTNPADDPLGGTFRFSKNTFGISRDYSPDSSSSSNNSSKKITPVGFSKLDDDADSSTINNNIQQENKIPEETAEDLETYFEKAYEHEGFSNDLAPGEIKKIYDRVLTGNNGKFYYNKTEYWAGKTGKKIPIKPIEYYTKSHVNKSDIIELSFKVWLWKLTSGKIYGVRLDLTKDVWIIRKAPESITTSVPSSSSLLCDENTQDGATTSTEPTKSTEPTTTSTEPTAESTTDKTL